jgi:hypothetical protein
MSQEVPLKLPINLILLDGVGAVLLALGLAEHFAGLDVLPTALSFEYRAYVLMAAGVVLMLPLVFYILNWARSRSEGSVLK